MASAVRKSPNCFSLLRQIEVLQKAGNKNNAEKILEATRFEMFLRRPFIQGRLFQINCGSDGFQCVVVAVEVCFCLSCVLCNQDWSKASSVAKAFQLGKLEAGAVCNLMSNMEPQIQLLLCESVRAHGMKGFITHEMLAKQLFNSTFCSAMGSAEAWAVEASNKNSLNVAP